MESDFPKDQHFKSSVLLNKAGFFKVPKIQKYRKRSRLQNSSDVCVAIRMWLMVKLLSLQGEQNQVNIKGSPTFVKADHINLSLPWLILEKAGEQKPDVVQLGLRQYVLPIARLSWPSFYYPGNPCPTAEMPLLLFLTPSICCISLAIFHEFSLVLGFVYARSWECTCDSTYKLS